jgi:antitoxin component YwqK of YwqJK toxin-antitoxin module
MMTEIRPNLRPDDVALPPELEGTHSLHRDYYDKANTQLRTIYATRNDAPTLKDGPDVIFRKDGRVWSIQDYSAGKLWTIHAIFGQDGRPLDHGTRKNGDGIQKSYHDDDTLEAEGPSEGGRSEGVWRYWYADGTLQAEGAFRQSAKLGPWKYFNPDGSVKAEEDYRDDGTLWVVFWAGGFKHKEGLRRKDAEGHWRDVGPWKYFNPDGSVKQEEDYRDDGTLWVVFWAGGSKQAEGLRRKDAEGHWRDDGPWARYENGKLSYTDVYKLGNHVRRIQNPEPILNAMRSKPDWRAQLEAIDKARDGVPGYTYLQALHATGELVPELALAIGLEAYHQDWEPVFAVILSYGEAMIAPVDAEATSLAAEKYPNPNRSALLCLWRWELGGRQPVPTLYEPLLKCVLKSNDVLTDHNRVAVEKLRELVKSYPTDVRQTLVRDQWGKPIPAYAGLAADPEIVQQTIDAVLRLDKFSLRHDRARAASLKSMLEEVGAMALPGLIAALQGDGKKAPARQVLVQVLAKSGAPESASVLLEFVNDKVDAAALAAREGLVSLGELTLPAIEEALGGRSKALKIAAAETLGKLEPSDAVRGVAERRLAAEKNAELRALLEPIAAAASREPAVEELPPGYAAIVAERAALADRRDAVLAELEAQPSDGHVKAFLTEQLATEPSLAVLFAERFMAGPPLRGLDWDAIVWPLHRQHQQERIGWLGAEMFTRRREGRRWTLPELYRAARKHDARTRDPIPEETPGPFPQALAYFLSRGERVPTREVVLAWLEENAPSVSAKAFAAHVDDAAKPVRDIAVRGLIAAGEASIAVTLPLLAGSTKQQEAAAEVLRAVPRAVSIAPLEAALAKEKNAKRREALESALLSCRLAAGTLDVETLDATLATRAPATVAMPKEMPELRWRGGTSLSEPATRWLLAALRIDDGSGPPNAELAGVRSQLEDEPAHALCRAILASFPETPAERWVRYQRALLGDDTAMYGLGKMLGNDVYRFSADFAAHGVEVLRRNPTASAVRWLEHYSLRSKGKLEREAEQAMRALASDGGRDELVDRSMPRLDDEASRALVTERLENAMCTCRRWTIDAWRDFVLGNPIAAALAPRILFACFEGATLRPFRVVDGAPVDLEGHAFELRGSVGIPHPVELDAATIDAWIDVFAEPPFEQLDRPATPDASEVLRKAMPTPPILADELLEALEESGFVAEIPEDAGLVWGARKRLGATWTLRVGHTAYSARSRRPVEGSTLVVEGVSVEGDGAVPAALWSEALQAARRLVPTLA